MTDAGNSRHGRRQPPTMVSSTTTTTHGPTTTTTSSTMGGTRTTITTSRSGPQSTTTVHPTVTTTHSVPYPQVPSASAAIQTERRPSIRIRKQAAEQSTQTQPHTQAIEEEHADVHGYRRRSSSEPQRPQIALLPWQDDEIQRLVTATPLQTLHEEGSTTMVHQQDHVSSTIPVRNSRRPMFARQASAISLRRPQAGEVSRIYDADLVDMLDVLDPEVSTLTTLNNVQNSLFIPNLGWLYNRQPTYDLSQSPQTASDEESSGKLDHSRQEEQAAKAAEDRTGPLRPAAQRLTTNITISSVLTGTSEGHNYAVLPHGASLSGWTPEEKAMLNDHVRHLMHSRRAKFKRGMRGFGRYVRQPVGFLVSLYAFLLTFWGAAWVLFLIGWIGVGGRQAYFIEICDQILTALFCVVGIGLAPWRAIDTYHMIYVAKYAHKTWELRKERGLPDLKDHNELPTLPAAPAWEKGEDEAADAEAPVLKASEQQTLEYHQNKLARSHTFYKPHETTTHSAFSVRLLIATVVLLDCHSLFQMALGGTTWGIYYKVRPKALTAVILTCSISCNVSAGITISVGDRRSRKKLIVEQMFRQGLTEEALTTLRKEKGLVAGGLGRQGSKKNKSTK